MTGTNVVVFFDHRGATIAINADGPVSCLRGRDQRRHAPFGLGAARKGRVDQLLTLCTSTLAHALSVEPVDCGDCLDYLDGAEEDDG